MNRSGNLFYLRDLAHVEADGGDHVLVEVARGDHVDEGRLARVLQPDQGQLHLLLPEQRLEPLQQTVDHGKHLDSMEVEILRGLIKQRERPKGLEGSLTNAGGRNTGLLENKRKI